MKTTWQCFHDLIIARKTGISKTWPPPTGTRECQGGTGNKRIRVGKLPRQIPTSKRDKTPTKGTTNKVFLFTTLLQVSQNALGFIAGNWKLGTFLCLTYGSVYFILTVFRCWKTKRANGNRLRKENIIFVIAISNFVMKPLLN